MARTLLQWLISIAKQRKLDAVVAYTRGDNKPMQAIFLEFNVCIIGQVKDEVQIELKLIP